MFISLYTTRLILNSLGASDFGIFNIVGGAISMLGFLNAAMAGATQRFMSYSEGAGDKEKQKSIFNVSFILHLSISIIVGIILLIAGYFFFNGILNIPNDRIFAAQIVYGSLIISTMFTVMTVPYDAAMNAHENMKYYAIIGIFESILKLGVALICVYTSHDKLIIYGILMASIPLITLTIMRIYCHKHYKECVIAPRIYWDISLIKQMTSFAGWHFLSTASSMIANYGIGILINHFFGTLINAAQGIANQVNGQIITLSNNFIKAVAPVMSKSAGKQNIELLQKTTIESSRITTILYCLIAIPIFLYSPYIFKLWLKQIPDYTILFSRFIIIINLIEFQYLSLTSAIRSVGKITQMSQWTSCVNIISIFAIYIIFMLNFDAYYLYIILIITKFLLLINVTYNAKIYCRFTINSLFKSIFIPLNSLFIFVICIMLLFSLYYPCHTFNSFLINIAIYLIVMIFSLSIIINKYEKDITKRIITNIIKRTK